MRATPHSCPACDTACSLSGKYHFYDMSYTQDHKKEGGARMVHRTKKMTFRLTDEEYSIIKNKVQESGISQQQFLLKTALEKEIICIKEFQALMLQIKRIGVNINQIARHMNETGAVTNTEIAEVKEGLNQIWQLLNQLKIHSPK